MRNADAQRYLVWIGLAAVMAVGAFLRIEPINGREFWGDEAFTSAAVRQPWGEMMAILVRDVHPPLYYWLLKIWTMGFGAGTEALRGFSVVFGVAVIPVAFVAMRNWYKASVWPAFLAALVIAVNPFLVAYGHEARMYALLAFLVALTVLLLTRSWSSSNAWWRVGYAIALTAICYTHYVGVLFAVGCVLVDVVRRPSVRQLLLGYAIPALAAIPLLLFFVAQQQHTTTLGWVPQVTFSHIATAWEIFMFGSPVGVYGVPPANTFSVEWLQPTTIAIALAAVLGVTAAWLTLRKRWTATLILLGVLSTLPLVLTWALQFIGQNLFVERYLIGASVALTLFLILAYAKLKTPVLAGLGTIYIAVALLVSPTIQEPMYIPLTDTLRQSPQVPVVFTDASDFTISRHYLSDDARIYFYNAAHPSEDLSDWTVVRGHQIMHLPEEAHMVITTRTELFPEYVPVGTARWLTILQSPAD